MLPTTQSDFDDVIEVRLNRLRRQHADELRQRDDHIRRLRDELSYEQQRSADLAQTLGELRASRIVAEVRQRRGWIDRLIGTGQESSS